MRIRKRKVPLPLSLLSPVPLSDPHLFSRSPVMLAVQGIHGRATIVDDDITNTYDHNNTQYSPPANNLTPTCSDSSTSDLRRLIVGNTTVHVLGFEGGEGVQTSNDVSSNASIITTTTITKGATAVAEDDDDANNNNRPLSLSNNEGRWCDGDKAIPLKKRRGISSSFSNFAENLSTIVDMEKDTTMKITECVVDETEKEIIQSKAVVVVTSGKKGSNSKRGNTIMEGSRCSRVNGRGWRCCQPTLVGYSLCEHHLGKGRLRNITSSNSSAKSKKKSNAINNTHSLALGRDERDDDREKKLDRMSSFGNKKVKLGVVKARSLSSLLGQTNTIHLQHQEMSNLDEH